MDTFRLKRRAGAIVMLDLLGCFDRLVHTVLILVLMSYGMSPIPLQSLFEATQNADHSIKTSYGVSDPTYGKTNSPTMGTGQGARIGPSRFALLSCKMIEMMKRKDHGVDFLTSLLLSLISITCFAYIDDTDLVQSAPSRKRTGEEIIPDFQEALDRWAGAVQTTGGELAPHKSCFTLKDFEWNGND